MNTGSNLVLIDAGAGNVYDDNLGRLTDNIVLAGYQPEEVDILVATHMHFDHVGGFSRDGACVFPNATVYLVEDESRFWLDTPLDEIPENSRQYVQWARDAVAPYLAAGKVEHYSLGDILFPGIGHVQKNGQRSYSWVPVEYTP